MEVVPGTVAAVLREARERSGHSRSALARAAGTSRAALDQMEKEERMPRVDTFLRVLDATGATAVVEFGGAGRLQSDPTTPGCSLASFCQDLEQTDDAWKWRTLISDFVANEFVPASSRARALAIANEPPSLGSARWDTFAAALGEHLAFHADIHVPTWVSHKRLGLDEFWWPVHGELRAMRGAGLAYSPASFKRRRILVDGRELPLVVR